MNISVNLFCDCSACLPSSTGRRRVSVSWRRSLKAVRDSSHRTAQTTTNNTTSPASPSDSNGSATKRRKRQQEAGDERARLRGYENQAMEYGSTELFPIQSPNDRDRLFGQGPPPPYTNNSSSSNSNSNVTYFRPSPASARPTHVTRIAVPPIDETQQQFQHL